MFTYKRKNYLVQTGFRTEIKLRVTVLHSNPFAIVEHNEETGEITTGGLQIDLLERFIEYAADERSIFFPALANLAETCKVSFNSSLLNPAKTVLVK